ncbi:conserved hypothetical protein [Clostridium ljungdahlii DSM 13528]|uniref:Uncharacterized protein n=3 Tax=Clostridium TaxID=1485 RepID=D8GR64_CLOLD|nr:conserved hypothetical protein [Clostridium ljungdahlii DSM 13528]
MIIDMNISEKTFLKNVCKYCINKYTISNNGPLIASLIYQICKHEDMDVPAMQGILRIYINKNYSRSFAHCFNVYRGVIVDASLYQYALVNKPIENLFPVYIVDATPPHIEYTIYNEIKKDSQVKFSDKFLENTLKNIKGNSTYPIKRFTLLEDSKKEELFFCH